MLLSLLACALVAPPPDSGSADTAESADSSADSGGETADLSEPADSEPADSEPADSEPPAEDSDPPVAATGQGDAVRTGRGGNQVAVGFYD